MLHVVLAFSIVCLAMGVAVVVLCFLAYVRFSSIAFRSLAAVVGASLLILIVDLLKEYDLAVSAGMAGRLLPLFVMLSAAGFGLFAWSAPVLAFRVVKRKLNGAHRAAVLLLVVLLLVIGIRRELRPGTTSDLAVVAGTTLVQAYGLVILGRFLSSVENRRVRQVARSMLFIMPPLMLVVVVQLAAGILGWAPVALRDFPIAEIGYMLIGECLLLVYGLLYLFRQEPAGACVLPDQFVERYSISPRECEIISMIVQGYSNRMIGEKLYISAMTVKNHIYHIYQKTSVENKIQLVNLMNSLK